MSVSVADALFDAAKKLRKAMRDLEEQENCPFPVEEYIAGAFCELCRAQLELDKVLLAYVEEEP